MPRDLSPKARSTTRLLGALSVASGVAMLVAPEKMARVYKLPQRVGLTRTLGVRDVAVGVALLQARSSRAALLWRGVADALDCGLIASQVLTQTRRVHEVRSQMAGALGLAALSFELFRRTSPVVAQELHSRPGGS